jgi:hypothetical protein
MTWELLSCGRRSFVGAGAIGSSVGRTFANRETIVGYDVEAHAIARRPSGVDARSLVACTAALSCGVNGEINLARETC